MGQAADSVHFRNLHFSTGDQKFPLEVPDFLIGF